MTSVQDVFFDHHIRDEIISKSPLIVEETIQHISFVSAGKEKQDYTYDHFPLFKETQRSLSAFKEQEIYEDILKLIR